MSIVSIGTEEILRGEEGFVDLGKPAPAEPVRIVTPRQTKAQEHETLQKIATRVEAALKELRKPKIAAERIAELETQLRSEISALTGAISGRAREKATQTLAGFFAPRFRRLARMQVYTSYFQTVVDAKAFAQKCATARDHAILVECAAKAVELFKTECQDEAAKTS
jgi:hypothetical protein